MKKYKKKLAKNSGRHAKRCFWSRSYCVLLYYLRNSWKSYTGASCWIPIKSFFFFMSLRDFLIFWFFKLFIGIFRQTIYLYVFVFPWNGKHGSKSKKKILNRNLCAFIKKKIFYKFREELVGRNCERVDRRNSGKNPRIIQGRIMDRISSKNFKRISEPVLDRFPNEFLKKFLMLERVLEKCRNTKAFLIPLMNKFLSSYK